jgi:hypothetical protein
MRKDALRRYFVFRMKLMELIHFHLLWRALDRNEFFPDNVMGHDGADFSNSVRIASISWFCTVVDCTGGGLNAFDVWLQLFPRHQREIEAVRSEVDTDLGVLREFRDRCGFHADTPKKYWRARHGIVGKPQLEEALQKFVSLATFLIKNESEELPEFSHEVEEFLLEYESEFKTTVNRESFKRMLILPREN